MPQGMPRQRCQGPRSTATPRRCPPSPLLTCPLPPGLLLGTVRVCAREAWAQAIQYDPDSSRPAVVGCHRQDTFIAAADPMPSLPLWNAASIQADPGSGRRARVARVIIVRRAGDNAGRRDILGNTLVHRALLQKELLRPDAAQGLDCGDLAQSDEHLARRLLIRQVGILDKPAVPPLQPCRFSAHSQAGTVTARQSSA